MDSIQKNIDLSSMKRIGVITVDGNNLYRDVQRYIERKDITPTDFFYDKIKKSTYHADKKPILSVKEDLNLIVANKDNDAIFLYSENEVLSPTQFINLFVSLYNSTKDASAELEKNIYAKFGLKDLNINFINMILATDMTPEIIQQYDDNFKKIVNSEKFYGSELNNVNTVYNNEERSIVYDYSSQNGMNLMKFLDTMISLNPDIRVLMSNTIVTPSENSRVRVLLNALRNNSNYYKYYTDDEIVEDIDIKITAQKVFSEEEQEKFLKTFNEEQQKMNGLITESNKSYKVFPILKYILQTQNQNEEERKDLDFKYILKWYDSDPDNGEIAIDYALDLMSKAIRLESDYWMKNCRNLQEVKDYMNSIKNRALKINKNIKEKEDRIIGN